MAASVQYDQWLLVVPARLGSTRLPEKPLQDLCGKPLIVRVCEQLRPLTDKGAKLVAAIDHEKIAQACKPYGLECVMTSSEHQSGTDRVWEVAQKFPRIPYIMNVQGDEPFVRASDIETVMRTLESQSAADIATPAFKQVDADKFNNPNVVKAICAQNGWALYFTRACSPYPRDIDIKSPKAGFSFWQHMGVYAYRRASLKRFCELPPSPLEMTEKLEQLRALESGMKIFLCEAKHESQGIDTPSDIESARKRWH